MRPLISVSVLSLILCLAYALPTFADQTLMEATFDDKAIDQPIGTGGAIVGEPDYVTPEIEAIVRSAPFGTPCLEIHNTHATLNRSVWFSLPGASISSGLVVIILDIWLTGSGPGWEPYCEIYNENNQALTYFRFQADGTIAVGSGDGPIYVPSFPVGRHLPVLFAIDMDADTYSAWFDAIECVTDAPLERAGSDLKKIWFLTGSNCDPDNRYSIDKIRVIDWMPDDIAVEPVSWGQIRALYR